MPRGMTCLPTRSSKKSSDLADDQSLSMPKALLAVAFILMLGLAAMACQKEEIERQAPTATASPEPTVTASSSPTSGMCAAGSGDRLMEIQSSAPFQVYCPTFVPSGLTFLGAEYGGGVWLPVTKPTAIEAVFVDATGIAKVRVIQAWLDLDTIAQWFTPTGTTVMYDDLRAEVWQSKPGVPFATDEPLLAAVATSPEGVTHWVDVRGLDEDELGRITAGMKPLAR